jgi:hypothetical protein
LISLIIFSLSHSASYLSSSFFIPGHELEPEHACVSGSSFPSKGQSQYPSLIHSEGMTCTSSLQPVPHSNVWAGAALATSNRMAKNRDIIISPFNGNQSFFPLKILLLVQY